MRTDEAEIADRLQSCLESIERGQESIETARAAYPADKDLIRPELETARWIQARKRLFDPRPGFVAASRKRLIMRIEEVSRQNSGRPTAGFWGLLPNLKQLGFSYGVAILGLLLVALIFGGSSVAFAAKDSIPGDPLYRVKIAQENLQLALSLADKNDINLHTEFLRRRVEEIRLMAQSGRGDQVEAVLENYETHLNRALALVSKLAQENNPESEYLAGQLQEELAAQAAIFASIQAELPSQAEVLLQRALDITAYGLNAIDLLNQPDLGSTPFVQASPSQTKPAQLLSTQLSATSPADTAIAGTPAPVGSIAVEDDSGSKPTKTLRPTKTPKPPNPNRPTPRPTNKNKPAGD